MNLMEGLYDNRLNDLESIYRMPYNLSCSYDGKTDEILDISVDYLKNGKPS